MAFTSAREVDTVGEADSVTNEAKRSERYHTAGGGVVLAVALELSLIAVGIARHPASRITRHSQGAPGRLRSVS
jgi:hypothetical protein